jgi:hypothetical protein
VSSGNRGRRGNRGAGTCLLVVATIVACVAATNLLGLSEHSKGSNNAVDQAFARFWQAQDPQKAVSAADAVVRSGVGFDDALARLKHGREYSAQVPRGIVRSVRQTAAARFLYSLDVPQTYDPSRTYQVRVQLHGGVMRPAGPRGDGSIGALGGGEQIYVIPIAWNEAPWWSNDQVENVLAILDSVKRTYNVDENHIALSGVSDGGTATYYFAMRAITPFSSFLPLNGFIRVLNNEDMELGDLYPNNLLNRPFFIVNGGRDPLYPVERVEPVVDHFEKGGVVLSFLPQPNAVHNTAWWPEVKDRFEAFVRDHPRTSIPSKLTWETDGSAQTRRAHWMIIDRLARASAEPGGPGRVSQRERGPQAASSADWGAGGGAELPDLKDLNDVVVGVERNFGVRTDGMRITSVQPGSNASTIGLRAGDTVSSVNGRALPAGLDLLEYLDILPSDERLALSVARGDQRVELSGTYHPVASAKVASLFPHRGQAGRVDLVRDGNAVQLTSRGVAELTLLLSPDAFDLTRPVTVIADGKTVFDAPVSRNVATLMKWAAADNDRTMLFGAEVHLKLAQ